MRWFWIDRFTEFVSGKSACTIKAVTITEEQIDDYFEGYPILSPSFVLEGFAQTGGLLISEQRDFKDRVVLAKVAKSKFERIARPGDTLTYRIELLTVNDDGGLISATSRIGDEPHGEAELTFAYIDNTVTETEFFEPVDFLRMLRIFRLFDVAVKQDGSPIYPPPHLLEAENRALGLD